MKELIALLNNTNTIVSILAGFFAITAPLLLWYKRRKENKKSDVISQNVATRFIAIFESHGVHRNQIPTFFDHGLTFFHCSTDEELLKHLTNDILEAVTELFAINMEWLQGASDEIYPIHNFYKHPQECKDFLNRLKSNNNPLGGYVFSPSKTKNRDIYDSAIVITEEIGVLNNHTIERLHILGGWIFNYWRSRAYLTACASIALNNDIWLIGKECDGDWLKAFCTGKEIPKYDFDYGGFNFNTSKTWYVDEFIEQPEKYINGVSPEQNNFGLHSAISKWLELEASGYMSIDKYSNRIKIRTQFENYSI
jgi:hypothetical protein